MTHADVYFITHEQGFMKIGRASEPAKRCETLQTACPYELTLWMTVSTLSPSSVEAELHKEFSEDRVRGEWFDCVPEDIDQYIRSELSKDDSGILSVRDWSSQEVISNV